MKSRTSGYSSDTEQTKQQDLSVLRKPIFTAITGFLEAKRAYDNGTEEIRKLVSRECDIIYECKVCRNIFRSLTNFISHKRVYCRSTFNIGNTFYSPNNGFIDQDISTIIQAEQEYVNHSTIKDNKIIEGTNKDLSSIIERLVKREQANRVLKLTDFYDQVNQKLTQDDVLRQRHVLQLDRVPNSRVAVYQTVKTDDKDNIKKEVIEVDNLLSNDNFVLGQDGKIIPPSTESDVKTENNPSQNGIDYSCSSSSVNKKQIACKICDIKFSTEKTLKLHIQTKHIQSTYVYQCPSCTQTFLQPKAVIRHLSNDHKKSARRIRIMRDTILKRKIRIDEIQTKGPSRELSRLTGQNEKKISEEKNWSEEFDRTNNSPTCPFCGKSFERKAVLTTHLNSCNMKNKFPLQKRSGGELLSSTNKINDMKPTPKQPEEDTITKILGDFEKAIDLADGNSNEVKHKRKKTPKVSIKNDETKDALSLNESWSAQEKTPIKATTVTSDEVKSTEKSSAEKPKTIEPARKPNNEISFLCKICMKRFDALSNLRRHISMFHYRRRKYGCKLCDYRAFRKYDVINHLASTHSISGEKEVAMEYLTVHADEKSEENIDDDIIIAENDSLLLKSELNGKTQFPVQKRRRRSRKSKVNQAAPPAEDQQQPAPIAASIPKAITKFTRSSSNLSISSNEEQTPNLISKRPIRNRVKPVKKDFLYDLSNLLKKDMVLSERDCATTLVPAKTSKRRNTIVLSDEQSRDEQQIITTNLIDIKPVIDLIKGSALSMANSAVSTFTACFNKPPDIPIVRPTIPNRTLAPIRTESNGTTDNGILSFFGQNHIPIRDLSSDSLFSSLAKKRKLSIPNFSATNGEKKPTRDEKITVKCPTEKEFQQYLIANKLTDPVKKINIQPAFEEPVSDVIQEYATTPTNNKRITLLQRMAENKTKKMQQSLLKSALEN